MVNTYEIIKILNAIREDYEMIFSKCALVNDCHKCEEDERCFAYKAAQALGWAIKAVKSAQALSDAVDKLKTNIGIRDV